MHETLDDGDIDDTGGLALAAANPADLRIGQIEERPEPRNPLVHELAAMNQDEGVGSPLGEQRRRDHRLAEHGGGRKHARVVREQRGGGGRLLRRELPEERCLDRTAREPLVAKLKADAELFE